MATSNGGQGASGNALTLTWLGHACFYLVSPGGVRVVTDPFAASVPYPRPSVECDVVTVSHEHSDHNDATAVKGSPKVVRGLDKETGSVAMVKHSIGDVSLRTVASNHDSEGGTKRGKNAIFVMDVAGLTVVHLGDLGHELGSGAVREIGPVDILLIPVGGFYTVDGATAAKVAASLAPRVIAPMHFKTKSMASWPISGPEDFLSSQSSVRRVGSQVKVDRTALPAKPEVWLFEV